MSFFVKQAIEKWNVGYKSENQYETKMSTCESNYLEMCTSLFQMCEICHFKNVQLNRCDFCETWQWNVKI